VDPLLRAAAAAPLEESEERVEQPALQVVGA
jgi:hypothetical protein